MVANPRHVKGFAQACAQRAPPRRGGRETDRADARMILRFAQAMPFEPWTPPAPAVVELRAMSRRIAALVTERTREKNRLHALRASAAHSRLVARDIEVNLRHLERRIDQMQTQAVALVGEHAALAEAFRHLTSVKGIAARTAVTLLAELLVLPPGMTARQWVAHAGLDPREITSGSSVRGTVRISKVGNVHLRRALYMPALVASRSEPRVKAYYEELVAKGKKPKVAVMRKLLHAAHGMLRHGEDFDGERFRATPQNQPTAA